LTAHGFKKSNLAKARIIVICLFIVHDLKVVAICITSVFFESHARKKLKNQKSKKLCLQILNIEFLVLNFTA